MENRITLLIHSCHKFSDLWEAHVKLLNENWSDRNIRTIILTDSPEEISYDGVEIISAGEGKEITERIRHVLPLIDTEYVLVTLDDYFPIYSIDNRKIERLVNIMDRCEYDYIRLFAEPKCPLNKTNDKGIYTYSLDRDYRVNLYSGIWRKSFMKNTLSEYPMSAWDYEVSLTHNAARLGASCAMSKGNEFPILDVVRKGRLLRPAARYLRTYNLYQGSRPIMPLKDTIQLNFKIYGQRIFRNLPEPIFNGVRRFMMLLGMKSFSGERENNKTRQ